MKYRQTWGNLPDIGVPAGPALKPGSTGERVSATAGAARTGARRQIDAALAAKVKEFQAVHGIKADGIAGAGTIEALNRGAQYYEQLIIINMERAKRLPAPQEESKYVLVDAGGATVAVAERPKDRRDEDRGRQSRNRDADDGRVHQVCERQSRTGTSRRNLSGISSARAIVARASRYLTDREYQVLTGYGADAQIHRSATVDWQAVVDGRQDVALRRLPSPANSMGMMKFMLPNYFGIYLHDSPEKEHFTKNELWVSNGCVRLEDYKRVAKFLFDGSIPQGDNPKGRKGGRSASAGSGLHDLPDRAAYGRRSSVPGRSLRPGCASHGALRLAADGGRARAISFAVLT